MLRTLIDNTRTDKITGHSYIDTYENLFAPIRKKVKNVIEIGVYDGGSIRLWADYFPNATVRGVDIRHQVWDAIANDEKIKLYMQTDAYNPDFVSTLKDIRFDVLIDDGPHTKESMINFIRLYSPLMSDDSVLIIEDIQSETWIPDLLSAVPPHLKHMTEIVDLRKVRNQYDDLLLVIRRIEPESLPIVIPAYNNLFFVRRFIEQCKRFPNPIVILDNHSDYEPLLEYYKSIESDNITIHLLPENYGHLVSFKLPNLLPSMYVLSDPDLDLHPDMPSTAIKDLMIVSERYKCNKVGLALDISDHDKFIAGDYGKMVYNIEKSYYTRTIEDKDYILYVAPTDTTFCLVNNKHSVSSCLRIGGNFTARHLPWYDGFLQNNVPKDELDAWKRNNKSSSILNHISL